MKSTLYIIRHTETVGNIEHRLMGRKDYEITQRGQEYMEKLTQRLKDVKIDKAYSSTSLRAIKTIEPLAALNNIHIVTTDKLCEMYFGIYDGWKWDDVDKIDPTLRHRPSHEIENIPEQETTNQVADRMYSFLRNVCIENPEKTILIASHGVAIEAFMRKITHEKFYEHSKENSQQNTSVNIVEYDFDTDSFKILLLNSTKHLR